MLVTEEPTALAAVSAMPDLLLLLAVIDAYGELMVVVDDWMRDMTYSVIR